MEKQRQHSTTGVKDNKTVKQQVNVNAQRANSFINLFLDNSKFIRAQKNILEDVNMLIFDQ